ncbi:hypothetical protein JRO89_XS11G0219000 [Xanthoceras sorbifolium]|uniref:Uncharacterized protein n=1 Tax=Xanthoceras sorbifolium TaxID=99658 RepID=A0ABQ8HGN5_9ROSI|nr:hypothetical protein JRO89_XS11G0219000 [Xanthoceras sorbifolium]
MNIQWEVEEYLQCQETEHVNVENLFNGISSHLKRSIKHQLYFEILKKVEEFGKWSEDLLYHMVLLMVDEYLRMVTSMEKNLLHACHAWQPSNELPLLPDDKTAVQFEKKLVELNSCEKQIRHHKINDEKYNKAAVKKLYFQQGDCNDNPLDKLEGDEHEKTS